MKIMIINPNSSVRMTADIDRAAKAYAGDDLEVVTVQVDSAPPFIDTYEDKMKTAPGMAALVRAHQDEVDAFIVACHCDPNLDLLKEVSKKPVVGIGEASMKLASMLGHSFSVISTGSASIPGKEALIHSYWLDGYCASVRAPGDEHADCDAKELFLETARTAIKEDGAEVIVMGCAGLCGLTERLERELGVPVLDGVVCALIIAEGLVKAKLGISKVRRYGAL